jgi:cell division protein FtsW (lipid II flippase)
MTEQPQRTRRPWGDRIYLCSVFLLTTAGVIAFSSYIATVAEFTYNPSINRWHEVFGSAVAWIVSFVGAAWILYRRNVSGNLRPPWLVGLSSAIVVIAIAVGEVLLLALYQIALSH